jgi:hypothetical protein
MNRARRNGAVALGVVVLCVLMGSLVFANGGPFVIKYPDGDPAARGILARLDADLKPGRETRLRVIKEDLKLTFGKDYRKDKPGPPLVRVAAEYTIENPTNSDIEVDFGFPILRGVYMNPRSMLLTPDVSVHLGKTPVKCTIISNSAIYGIIRQRAREVIEKAVAEDVELGKLVTSVRRAQGKAREVAREGLLSHLRSTMSWNERDAALMVEYASLDFGKPKTHPADRGRGVWILGPWEKDLYELMNANLGSLAAIGEQKATQFFAQLASRFDPQAAAAYEAIFAAWGGDVRERSVDLETGEVRPREITVLTVGAVDISRETLFDQWVSDPQWQSDPTIYARVDYLDPKAVLKNLPVVFTFAPMNILHYQAKFPAKSTETLTVSYTQYAYSDTRSPSSYQLAYVVHPASLWEEFGPINLEVAVPEGVPFRASVECDNGGIEERQVYSLGSEMGRFSVYRAVLGQKTGELYFAVDAEAWKTPEKQVAAGGIMKKVPQVLQGAAQKVGR